MTISRLRVLLKQGKTGTFRMLKPGEIIEPADIIVWDCLFDSVSEPAIGEPASDRACIMRLEFPNKKPITKRRTIHKK